LFFRQPHLLAAHQSSEHLSGWESVLRQGASLLPAMPSTQAVQQVHSMPGQVVMGLPHNTLTPNPIPGENSVRLPSDEGRYAQILILD
jgi:hypothetical protein